MGILCKICNLEVSKNTFKKHLLEHNIDSIEFYAREILKLSDKCKYCGKETKFKNLVKGFREFCSVKCSTKYNANNDVIKQKRKKTNIEKYGGHPSKHEVVKSRMLKTLDNKKQDKNYQLNINKKRELTNLAKYGVKFTSQSKEYKDTLLDNIKTKYEEITDSTFISKLNEDYYIFKCNKCNKEYTIHRHLVKQRSDKQIEVCTNCIKKNTYSSTENSLLEYIVENYNGKIISNDRNILDGKEIDIYLPELNLAFEFNGLYWHSELHRNKNYHLDKTVKCLDLGIQLIHIYEDDWLNKQHIVKSRLLNLLNKSKRIFARQCIIKEVTSLESNNFLINNHIQGKVNSKISYGLYYNNELVSLMTFGINRFRKDNTIELLRFCNKLNLTVIGGASRLFVNAMKYNNWKEVISYADRSWSTGGLYKKLGFNLVGSTPANYYYIVDNKRENRFKYRKSKLVELGNDINLTEKEIMFSKGLYRIYDSGSLIFIFTI